MSPLNVVVIGGGIIGASIGWHLQPDANVTFVAEAFGGVATPLSFAWINAYTTDDDYFVFRNHSMDHWVEIAEALPHLPIKFNGSLTWDFATDELLDEYYQRTLDREYGTEMVDRAQIEHMQPYLTDHAIPDRAVLARREGQMEPEHVALGLIHDAQAKGASAVDATIYNLMHADDAEGGRVMGVNTSVGVIEADHVVVAAGLGTVPLLEAEGITLPLHPRAGLLINTLPVAEDDDDDVIRELWWGNIISMRQTAGGWIKAGLEEGGGVPGTDPQTQADDVFAEVQRSFKNGDEIQYGGWTIGLRPQPDDGFPILGHTGIEGLTVAVMHSGVSNGAMVGKLIAKEVLTNVTDPLMEPFLLSRF